MDDAALSPGVSADQPLASLNDKRTASLTSAINLFSLTTTSDISERKNFQSQDGSGEEDYSASVRAVISRREGRRSFKRSRRRLSSSYDPENVSRRFSVNTISSVDSMSVEAGYQAPQEFTTQDQIFSSISLHKEVLGTLKYGPWPMKKKLKLVRKAKAYIKDNKGALQSRLAQSKSTRDILARFNILIVAKWQRLNREAANFSNLLVPWEVRIKEIESHFGSVVASYFTFLRWLFWVNLIITTILLMFVIVPEVMNADPKMAGSRKIVGFEERNKSTNLLTLWEFGGVLKVSPFFYGFYTNIDSGYGSYRLPLAYFLTGLAVYIYSFVAILKKMAENSRMSKLSEKEDECTFSWKLFTGWDFMIGNGETAHNRIASIILGFKEALLEEAEKKKDPRNWKFLTLRCLVNLCVMLLLIISAYAVVKVVKRSKEPNIGNDWWRQNETTAVMSLISFFFPMIFEVLGFLEHYHPRKQLRVQLARIMVLNLLNLYSLIFASFSKIDEMTKLEEYKQHKNTQNIINDEESNCMIEIFFDETFHPIILLKNGFCSYIINGKEDIACEQDFGFEVNIKLIDSVTNSSSIKCIKPLEHSKEVKCDSIVFQKEVIFFDILKSLEDKVNRSNYRKNINPFESKEDEAGSSAIFTNEIVILITKGEDKYSSNESLYEVETTSTENLKKGREISHNNTYKPYELKWVCGQRLTKAFFDTSRNISAVNESDRNHLLDLCWETMFGQELVKLTMMDLVMTVLATLLFDFLRAVFIRSMNECWCWDLEKKFPQYGDFKIAENILHLVNNQGMVWMGMFFSPGLVLINLIKLVVLLYLRSWAVMTCNVPHEVVFRASRSNNFYFALLLTMLFLCVLPVGYAIVWVKPSLHCGPFSDYDRIYYILTKNLNANLPSTLKWVTDYIASPGIVIPLLVLLILIIYYLTSLTNSLREANNDLKIQLRRERTEERRKMFEMADCRLKDGSPDMENAAFVKWKKFAMKLGKSTESVEKKNAGDSLAMIVKMALINQKHQQLQSKSDINEVNFNGDVSKGAKRSEIILTESEGLEYRSTSKDTNLELEFKNGSAESQRKYTVIPIIKISNTENDDA